MTPLSLQATIPVGSNTTRSITISNTGTATLTWLLSEAPGVSWLSESLSSGSTLPGAATPINATFDATGLLSGTYTATLRITSNDPDEPQIDAPITLTVLAPSIVITPGSLTVTLAGGLTTTRPITVANIGNADLTWAVSETPGVTWLTETPGSSMVSPGSSTPITVTFNTAGLLRGVYTTTLRFTGNDPARPQIEARIILIVPYQIYLPLIAKND